MPFHWSGIGSVNQVTTDATDPISGMPEFKVCAVDVSVAPDEPVTPLVEPVETPATPGLDKVDQQGVPIQKELST